MVVILNIVIAVGHIVGLIWADKMFEATGIGEKMIEHAQIHSSLPYVLTIFVAIVFLYLDYMASRPVTNSGDCHF